LIAENPHRSNTRVWTRQKKELRRFQPVGCGTTPISLKFRRSNILRRLAASHVHAEAANLYPGSSSLRSVGIRSAPDSLSPILCVTSYATPLGSLFWWLSSTSRYVRVNEAWFSPGDFCHPEGDQPFLPSIGFYPDRPAQHYCPALAGLSASTKVLLQLRLIRLPLLSNPASPPRSPFPLSVSVPVRTATRKPRVLPISRSVKRFFRQSVVPLFAPYIAISSPSNPNIWY
jgi:hypothetical protein